MTMSYVSRVCSDMDGFKLNVVRLVRVFKLGRMTGWKGFPDAAGWMLFFRHNRDGVRILGGLKV